MLRAMPTTVPLDIDPEEFRADRAAGRDVVLVDCREPWEYEIAHLEGALLLPLGELSLRVEEIPRGRAVVVYCHHGIRSRRGALVLRGAGIEGARSLAGGIDHWSLVVDPTLPRY